MAWIRAVRKRKANGNERQPSNSTTVASDLLTCRSRPNTEIGSPELRKAIGSSQPSSEVP